MASIGASSMASKAAMGRRPATRTRETLSPYGAGASSVEMLWTTPRTKGGRSISAIPHFTFLTSFPRTPFSSSANRNPFSLGPAPLASAPSPPQNEATSTASLAIASSNSKTHGTQPCSRSSRQCQGSLAATLWMAVKRSLCPSAFCPPKCRSQICCGTQAKRKTLGHARGDAPETAAAGGALRGTSRKVVRPPMTSPNSVSQRSEVPQLPGVAEDVSRCGLLAAAASAGPLVRLDLQLSDLTALLPSSHCQPLWSKLARNVFRGPSRVWAGRPKRRQPGASSCKPTPCSVAKHSRSAASSSKVRLPKRPAECRC
mmetsp:Transcript_68499/g.123423  ORF Transcript_68499/g.123423 Transcript_68499/m.123423 type:complete len:315 (+) Transcript_68499:907-1851(+)